MFDVIVIGGGLNGLVAGACVARRRLSTLIVEQRPVAGGAAVTSPITPGFHVPELSHALGPLRQDVVRALGLDHPPLDVIRPDPALTSLGPDGRVVTFHPDAVLTAGSINRLSSADAGRWREFLDTAHRLARVVAELDRDAPPALEGGAFRDRWRRLMLGRRLRSLGARDRARLSRYISLPIADALGEWFESDLLKAAIAAHATFGNFAGPRSAGTTAMWLQRLAEDPAPVGSGVTVRGGPGALSARIASAAVDAGAQIRTGARVVRITTLDGRANGVVLENGETHTAATIVSAVDPKQTLLRLVDPDDVPPTVQARMRHFRTRGVTAKVNLALSGLPTFTALDGDPVPLRGRFLVAPGLDYLEHAFDAAKYGRASPDPWVEFTVPSVLDPSLAPAGGHVMSIYVQYVPQPRPGADPPLERSALYETVMRVLAPHVPDLGARVVCTEVLTPDDLERVWGLSGGHLFHGETSVDQAWWARPLLGWSSYRTPIDGLYLAGAGAHPGGGLTGAPGLLAARAVLSDLRRRR